jgi:PilX N-terminal
MKTDARTSRGHGEPGFILATVLVFLVVLSLTAFFAARLTRANTQVVTNLQNEKQAFFVAEAGVNEALQRLSMVSPSCVSGISGPGIGGCSGGNVNASIAPRVTGATGRSPVGLTPTDLNSTTQVLLSGAVPASSGSNLTTPTLQPSASRLPYSTATADSSPVDLTATVNLSIGWDVCAGAAPSLGCSAANTIRQLPVSYPRPVVKIASTGQVRRADNSVVASRKITVWASDACTLSELPGNGSILTTGRTCSQGITMSGSQTIRADGAVTVDAGASGPCSQAINLNGSGNSVTAGEINTVGTVSGTDGQFDPDPKQIKLPVDDPYSSMLPPCYPEANTGCNTNVTLTSADIRYGTAANPPNQPFSALSNTTVLPGIYYGGIRVSGTNVKMTPGVYIMAGGGFSVSTGTTDVSVLGGGGPLNVSGVMIYNTLDPAHQNGGGAAASFDLSSGTSSPTLWSPTASASDPYGASDPFKGFVLFQDRNLSPQPDVRIQGGTTSARELDGIVYAPNAQVLLMGTSTINLAGGIVGQSMTFQGGSSLDITEGSTPPNQNTCTGASYKALAWQDF